MKASLAQRDLTSAFFPGRRRLDSLAGGLMKGIVSFPTGGGEGERDPADTYQPRIGGVKNGSNKVFPLVLPDSGGTQKGSGGIPRKKGGGSSGDSSTPPGRGPESTQLSPPLAKHQQ